MKTVSLNNLVSQDSPICYGILMPGEDVEGGIPVVKVRDYDHHGIDVSSLLRASPKVEAPYRRSRLEPGDILMAIRGTTGVLAIVPPELRGANITQDTARIRVDAAESAYVFQALQAPSVQRQIRLHTIGQAVRGINISSVRDLRIPWPDAWKRKEFADLMSMLDARIRQIDLLHQQKVTYKRGVAQQLLTGQRQFPKFRGKRWINVRLGDVFTERNETSRGDLPLLSVTGDRGIIPRDELDKRDTSNPDKSKYKRVAAGDIAYNTMRMWQGVSALSSLEGIVSPAYTVVVPTARIDGRFAKHLFKLTPVIHLFHRHSQGLVDDTLNLKYSRFARIHICIPREVEEQRKIAAILDLCDEELKQLATQRENYSLYKRGLLTRLLPAEHPIAT